MKAYVSSFHAEDKLHLMLAEH